MNATRYIKILLALLVCIIGMLYWQTLLRIIAWLIILYFTIKSAIRILCAFSRILIPIIILYLLFH